MEHICWWENIPSLGYLDEFLREGSASGDHRYYQFANYLLGLDSNDGEFSDRFERIYSECRSSVFGFHSHAHSLLTVRRMPGEIMVLIDMGGLSPENPTNFLGTLFPDHEYRELPYTIDSWRLLSSKNSKGKPVFAVQGRYIIADIHHSWQIIIAHFSLANIMRLQPDICFFHGATIAMGKGGVMLCGDKGAGKTTLSLALADRGHGFLSDEFASIVWKTGQVLPFRRAASIRKGPQTETVQQFLSKHDGEVERLPDGTTRRRVSVNLMFPNSYSRCSILSHVFFLRGFSTKPSAKMIGFGVEHLKLLSPLIGTMSEQSPNKRLMAFMKILSRVPCYLLTAGGTPEETAIFIESIVGNNNYASKIIGEAAL